MSIAIGSRVLVTVDNWFYAPDGKQYRAVFGTVRAIRSDQEALGIKTNAKSTNWYAEIGNATVAGCQIHYAVRCEHEPPANVEGEALVDGLWQKASRSSHVYNADAGEPVDKNAGPSS
jgi:hypothetical protein